MTNRMIDVQGHCPACHWSTLFLGNGGHITCSRLDCPNPSAADQLLHDEAATDPELRQRLDDAENVIAHLEDGEKLRLRAETELAALRQVARGYCPACGRGDAAPTVADWEQQKQRADQVEELLRIAHDTSNKSEAERARAVQRAETAERDAEIYRKRLARLTDGYADQFRRLEAAEADRDKLNRRCLTLLGDHGITTHRIDLIRDAARLHRQQLIGTNELYAVIEALDPPAPTPAKQTTDQQEQPRV